jgi:hypothetical protein
MNMWRNEEPLPKQKTEAGDWASIKLDYQPC